MTGLAAKRAFQEIRLRYPRNQRPPLFSRSLRQNISFFHVFFTKGASLGRTFPGQKTKFKNLCMAGCSCDRNRQVEHLQASSHDTIRSEDSAVSMRCMQTFEIRKPNLHLLAWWTPSESWSSCRNPTEVSSSKLGLVKKPKELLGLSKANDAAEQPRGPGENGSLARSSDQPAGASVRRASLEASQTGLLALEAAVAGGFLVIFWQDLTFLKHKPQTKRFQVRSFRWCHFA